MSSDQKPYKSRQHLPRHIEATAGISKKVDERREALERCISASKQPGDGIMDADLGYLAKTLV